MADSKVELVAAKKSGWLEGLQGLASFAGRTLVEYQTAKANPPTTTPAPAAIAASSSSSGTSRTSLLVIGGAAVLGFLLLRRR